MKKKKKHLLMESCSCWNIRPLFFFIFSSIVKIDIWYFENFLDFWTFNFYFYFFFLRENIELDFININKGLRIHSILGRRYLFSNYNFSLGDEGEVSKFETCEWTRVFLLTMHACNPLSKTSSLTYATWIFRGHSLSFIEV